MKELYDELVELIYTYGTRFPKKHGNWIQLYYIDGYSFIMDSWNREICIVQNAEYINQWNGLRGKEILCVGLDFGGFECYISENQLIFWIENLKYELGLDYDFSKIDIA